MGSIKYDTPHSPFKNLRVKLGMTSSQNSLQIGYNYLPPLSTMYTRPNKTLT
jgi:hypothetical protein